MTIPSEGFTQYAAALFTLSGLKDEDEFLDMLHAWRLDVLGQVNVAQGLGLQHYEFRPAVIRESDGNKSGPVVVGYRLRTSDTPMDWFFDQWVYGVDVPTYRLDLEVSPVIDQDLPCLLHGTVRREDVPDDF